MTVITSQQMKINQINEGNEFNLQKYVTQFITNQTLKILSILMIFIKMVNYTLS